MKDLKVLINVIYAWITSLILFAILTESLVLYEHIWKNKGASLHIVRKKKESVTVVYP